MEKGIPLYDTLIKIVDALRHNKGVSVIPTDTKLTTQQAADYLQISRPTLIRILTAGTIPFTTVGRHRRILLTDLMEYEDNLRKDRKEHLRALTQQASENSNYFDLPADFTDTRNSEKKK